MPLNALLRAGPNAPGKKGGAASGDRRRALQNWATLVVKEGRPATRGHGDGGTEMGNNANAGTPAESIAMEGMGNVN